jgi:hypothetical protein
MPTITRHSAIVLIGSVIISAAILIITLVHPKPEYSFTVFKTDAGWGYDILKAKKTVIHQQFIPGLPTMKGFEKKEQAERTAGIVIDKLKMGGFPSVTASELNEILKQ